MGASAEGTWACFRGCDLWEREELGGKDAGACATKQGVMGEREYTRARAGPESRGGVRAREQKRAVGRLEQ